MEDGLYSVSHGPDSKPIEASFTVEDGIVIRCAPILRKRFPYWRTKARRIGEPPR